MTIPQIIVYLQVTERAEGVPMTHSQVCELIERRRMERALKKVV